MVAPTGKIALSWSRIQDISCPHRFYHLYIAKTFKEPPTVPMAIGSLCHNFAEDYYLRCRKKGVQTDISILDDLFKETWETRIDILNHEHQAEAFGICKKFVDTHVVGPEFWKAEKRIALREDFTPSRKGWFGGDVFFRAIVDRVDKDGDAVIITDYTSGWSVSGHKKNQMKLYCLALEAAGVKTNKWILYIDYMRLGFCSEPTEFGPGVTLQAKQFVKKISAEVERRRRNRDWPAVPGSRCEWCRIPSCPAAAKPIGTTEDLAGRLLMVTKEKKELTERLKKHATMNGPVKVGDGEYKHVVSERITVDPVDWIEAGGHDAALSVSSPAAAKAIKNGLNVPHTTVKSVDFRFIKGEEA